MKSFEENIVREKHQYVISTEVLKCYIYETWTLSKGMMKTLEAADHWFLRRMLRIPWTDKVSTCEVFRRDRLIGLHQGSVLSPLLFAAVMDVVSSEAKSGLPSELLYADDLVIMALTMEQLGRRVAD